MSDDLDPRLKVWYDRLPKDEPSSRVDGYIRDAALYPGRLTPVRRDWFVSLGAVASVMMVCSLVAWLYTRAPSQWQQAVTVAPAPASAPAPAPAAQPAPAPAAQPAPPATVAPVLQESAPATAYAPKPMSAPRQVAPPAEPVVGSNTVETGRIAPAAPLADAAPARKKDGSDADHAERRDLPTVRLEPETAAAAPMAAPEAKAKLEAVKPVLLSVAVEGVSLGMSRARLLDELGWNCPQAICQRMIVNPRQERYWTMPARDTVQKIQLGDGGVVTAMSLSRADAEINNIKLAMERMGFASDRQCPLGGGDLLTSRVVGTMILNLWSDGGTAIVSLCAR